VFYILIVETPVTCVTSIVVILHRTSLPLSTSTVIRATPPVSRKKTTEECDFPLFPAPYVDDRD